MQDDSLLNYSNLFLLASCSSLLSNYEVIAYQSLCTRTWLLWQLTSEKEQKVAIGSELEWLFVLEHQNTKLLANNFRSPSDNFAEWILENDHPCRLTEAFERREASSMWCRLWKELSGEVTTATDKEYLETLGEKASWQQPTCYMQSGITCNPFRFVAEKGSEKGYGNENWTGRETGT